LNRPRVASVTVAFNPDAARLSAQVAALRGQVDLVVIVDNGSQPPVASLLEFTLDPGLLLLDLGDNLGVAAGFNRGIASARERGCAFALLLDHDSIPTPGMTASLVAALSRPREPGEPPIAAAGPRVTDTRDRMEYPFIRLGWTHNRHLRCSGGAGEVIPCDFLISSGSLIPMASFDAVGEFDETLFIDSVDLEWCCRARSRGLALHGVCDARLEHWLGDHRRAIVGGLTLVVHSPKRIYYMTRNRFLLYRRGYVPLKWKLKDFLRSVAKFSATMAFIAPRGEYARMTMKAVRDAGAGRGGKMPVGPEA
jgi:rhamnosyltransferase